MTSTRTMLTALRRLAIPGFAWPPVADGGIDIPAAVDG
jgi:hypothetical protein